jgi:hypothetical protein
MLVDTIGLDKEQAKATIRLWEGLLESGMPEAEARAKLADYIVKQKKYRALRAAVTETNKAASKGQSLLWKQAVEQGFLNPATTLRIWIISPLDVCDICGPMDGVTTTLDGTWFTSKGEVSIPQETHPWCKCSQGLVFGAERSALCQTKHTCHSTTGVN